MKRVDPIFDITASVQHKATPVNTRTGLVAANETPPLSPQSQKPMQLVELGMHGEKPILAWVDLNDRIAIPVRE